MMRALVPFLLWAVVGCDPNCDEAQEYLEACGLDDRLRFEGECDATTDCIADCLLDRDCGDIADYLDERQRGPVVDACFASCSD